MAGPEFAAGTPLNPLTPVQHRGGIWCKREDLYELNGIRGSKVRAAHWMAQGAPGLVAASHRDSPQQAIVARVAAHLGVPSRIHVPSGPETPMMADAVAHGASLIRVRPGYNNVIRHSARRDARARGWREIPFGMLGEESPELTAAQFINVPPHVERIVLASGPGATLSGIIRGIVRHGLSCKVLAVIIGADPRPMLAKLAPSVWPEIIEFVPAGWPYHHRVPGQDIAGIRLDPIYEAKALPFLREGDLFWIVGIRPGENEEDR